MKRNIKMSSYGVALNNDILKGSYPIQSEEIQTFDSI